MKGNMLVNGVKLALCSFTFYIHQKEIKMTNANIKTAYSVPELASVLGVSETHIWNAIRRDDIKTFTLGRRRLISGTELKRLMNEEE